MIRRQFTQLAAALALSPVAAQAQFGRFPGQKPSASDTVVLELINFQCPRCRAVNDHVPRMREAARRAELDFRVAPVAWEQQSIWPARVFYAVRDLFPLLEDEYRMLIFDGMQREGMAFENVEQTLGYLERRAFQKKGTAVYSNFSTAAIAERAVTDAVLIAEAKAGRLLEMSNAQEVPVFLWIKGGNVQRTITPKAAGGEPVPQVNLVLRTLAGRPEGGENKDVRG